MRFDNPIARCRVFAAMRVVAIFALVLTARAQANNESMLIYMDWTITCTPTWCGSPTNQAFDTPAQAAAYGWSSYTRQNGYEIPNYYPGYDYVCGPAIPFLSPEHSPSWYWVTTVEYRHQWCRWRNRATGQLEDNASLGNGSEGIWPVCEAGTSMQNMPDGYAYCVPGSSCLDYGSCRLKQIDPPDSCPKGNPTMPATGVKVHRETDLTRGGVHSLELHRQYRSFHHNPPFRALSGYWTTNWHRRLSPNFGFGYSVAVVSENASVRRFQTGGSSYVVEPGSRGNLRRVVDGSGNVIEWTHHDDDNLETYNAAGSLLRVQTHNAALTSLSYSTAATPSSEAPGPGYLIAVSDVFGRAIGFNYDPSGRLVKVTSAGPTETRYDYDSAGNLSRVTWPDGKSRAYHYEDALRAWLLTGITDEGDARLSIYSYDTTGRVTQTQRSGGAARHTFAYGSSGVTTVTDPLGTSRVLGYAHAFGVLRPTTASQPSGSGCGPSSSAITYDAQANVSSRTDFNNNKICYAYDLSRNLETKRVEGVSGSSVCSTALSSPPTGSRVISTQWHPDWRLETRIAEPKKLTTITYNGQGASCAPSTLLVDGKPPAVICTRTEQGTTDETGAAGFSATMTGAARTWRYTYTTYGRVLTATDPNNRTTTTSYHPDNDANLGKRGNVASITNAANHTTYLTDYNPHGQPTRIVDPNGVVTVLTYDPRMRLSSRTVGNEATVFGYDPVGQMTSVNLPDGARLTYTYDAAHRLTAINDHKGNRIDYTLDAMGNRTAEQMKDPGGVLVGNIARVIDALNRVQQVTGAVQ